MNAKKITITFLALFIVTAIVLVATTNVSAGCRCESRGTAEAKDGVHVFYEDGTGVQCVDAGGTACTDPDPATSTCTPCNPLTEANIKVWFRVPTLGDLIGNVIRLIFFIAGLYALVLLLLGGFEWVSSGGDDKKLSSARGKIINAIIGLVVMVAVLTLVILLEQVVFGGKVCLGISCPINMGDLRIIK